VRRDLSHVKYVEKSQSSLYLSSSWLYHQNCWFHQRSKRKSGVLDTLL